MKTDWNNIWKEQMEKHQQLTESRCELMWNSMIGVHYYVHMMQKCHWGDTLTEELLHLPLTKQDTILDIGAGPGTHTLPLASRVAHITAIEPASAMFQYLQTAIQQQGLTNVQCILKRWEDIDITQDLHGSYDIVLASFSLSMTDIRTALHTMNHVGKKIYLLWHIGVPAWEELYFALWEKMHNKTYYPVPKAECLLHVLGQLNISPKTSIHYFDNFYEFSSYDESVEYFSSELDLHHHEQKEILKQYLDLHLQEKKNRYVFGGRTYYAMISWKNTFDS